jgi:HEAT repeat protein
MTKRDQWIVYGLFALILFIAASFLVAVLRQEVPESSIGTARSADLSPTSRLEQTRKELVWQLIAALQKAAKENDLARIAEVSDTLARQGEASVPFVLETLGQDHTWNVRIALLGVLERIRSASAVKGLEKFYGVLTPSDSALKLEVIRRMSRIGGGETRRALVGMLPQEKEEKARGDIAQDCGEAV